MPSRTRVIIPIYTFPMPEKGRLTGSVLVNGEEVKSRMTEMKIVRRATVGIDTASFVLANTDDQFSNKWTGGESVEIKFDFNDGSTTVFKGYLTDIGDVFGRFPAKEIACSGFGIEAQKNPVFKVYGAETDIGQIMKELVEAYLPGHTTANIDTATGVTATPNWQGKDVWDCFYDLAVTFGSNLYDFYVDFDKDWHFFLKGSRTHGPDSGIAIIYGQNHRSTKLTNPFAVRANSVTVIGRSIKGQTIMATKTDDTDQATYWPMRIVIRDDNILTSDSCAEAAQYQLDVRKNIGRSGDVFADGMPTALPGYNIFIYDPHNNMNSYFTMSEITHAVSKSDYGTTIKIHENMPRKDPFIQTMKAITESSQKMLDIDNPYDMRHAYAMAFDNNAWIDTVASNVNVGVSNGRLILTSGTTGTFVSVTETADETVGSFILSVTGSGYDTATFYVSLNDGGNYQAITPNTKYDLTNFTAPFGNSIKVKVSMVTATSIETLGVKHREA